MIQEDNKLIYKLYNTKTNKLLIAWMDIIVEENKFTRIIGNSVYNFRGNRLIKYEINKIIKRDNKYCIKQIKYDNNNKLSKSRRI